VPDGIQQEAGREVTCPHCKRPFTPALLSSPSGQAQGYKCPHCRLFVAIDRAAPTA
jgi:transposase-like protein